MTRNVARGAALALTTFALAACSGGGGNDSALAPTPPASSPSAAQTPEAMAASPTVFSAVGGLRIPLSAATVNDGTSNCTGNDANFDIRQGLGIRVLNLVGDVVATGQLGQGYADHTERHCRFTWDVDGIPTIGSEFTVEVEGYGSQTYTRDALNAGGTELRIDVKELPNPEKESPSPASKPPKPSPSRPSVPVITDGTWLVGKEVAPGTYKATEETSRCYWEREKNLDGELESIIANGNGSPEIVTIQPTDAAFKSSGCGEWIMTDKRTSTSTTTIEPGTWMTSIDFEPGTYAASVADHCYWARLSDFSQLTDGILANDNVMGGRALVTIRATDKGFHSSGCGTWIKQ